MTQRTLLKRIATLLVGVLLAVQFAIAAHACPKSLSGTLAPAAAAMPDCDGTMAAPDSTASTLCAEHCKQGQQSDRTSPGMVVPPALPNALYPTVQPPEPLRARAPAGAWLSALVAASPPHAIAHCVLRI